MATRRSRLLILTAGAALAISGAVPLAQRLVHADAPQTIALQASNVQPRAVEDPTLQAASRAYARAWNDLSTALSHNDANALNASFVGFAHDRFAAQARDQNAAGFTTNMSAESHHAVVEFYSIDGSSMQIRDDVQLKREIMDGGKTIATETKTVPYIAVLSVVDEGWKVRLLQPAQP